MKTVASIIIIFTVSLLNLQKVNAQQTVTATVVNVTSDNGKVYFSLYTKNDFRKKSLQSKEAIIKDGKSTVTFEGVAEGEYAIICYHDKNSNNKMDFSPNGMPLEDYGSTNNVLVMGPPQFDLAKFVVADKDVSFEIKF